MLADGDKVIYTITGADQAAFRPAVADLRPYADREMYVRLVDDETGASTATYIREHPWAHLSFDHFRFHATRPFFAAEITPADITTLPPMDPVPNAGLSPADAARAMRLPPGFSVKLAASEPDVVRPIAFTLDDRGRLWVAEAHTYPVRAPEGKGRDRILILEDTNGDGTLDTPEGFHRKPQSGQRAGGRFRRRVGSARAPTLLFIPDNDGDRRARRASRRCCSTAGAFRTRTKR